MCWKCGNSIQVCVSRNDVCSVCAADVHSCRNCKFFAPGQHYDCQESSSLEGSVNDKERANFCDYFKLNCSGSVNDFDSIKQKQAQAKNAFNALFGD